MMKYYDVLKTVGLFRGIEAAELLSVLKCLSTEIKNVGKDEIILLAGDRPRFVGVVLAGQLYITREDYDGVRTLVAAVSPGEIFAEALCCAGVPESPVTVVADTDAVVMLMDFKRILHTCPNSCAYHSRLIENMLRLIAGKNMLLQSRMEIVCLKSVRAKIIKYLKTFVPKQGTSITIPFNREELASFLCVERSALSHELARMKKEGLIDYKKNNFTLYDLSSFV